MTTYNGHKNWNHWNVALWLTNDEGLYRLARECGMGKHRVTKDMAARSLKYQLELSGMTHTPDGAPYSLSAIRAALAVTA